VKELVSINDNLHSKSGITKKNVVLNWALGFGLLANALFYSNYLEFFLSKSGVNYLSLACLNLAGSYLLNTT
jgi:hypothetical protein